MRLGKLIRLTRLARGYTLRDVERISGLSNPYLCQIETGKVHSIGIHKAARLAKALGLTLDEMAATKEGKGR
jgi:transcriptional regulator with XRE-family HTH domain